MVPEGALSKMKRWTDLLWGALVLLASIALGAALRWLQIHTGFPAM